MKTKSWLFALGFSALLLSSCVGGAVGVGVGTGYGYCPPVDRFYAPYYAPVRSYYYYRPRPAVVVPRGYYRHHYRSPNRGYRNDAHSTVRPQYNGDGGQRTQGRIRRRVD